MNAGEALRLGEAVVRVLLDSEQTSEIHVAEELTGRAAFARFRRELFEGPEGRALLAERPELSSERVDFDALRALPPGTLGRAYVEHLDRHGLAADSQAAATRYVEDDEVAYLMRRFRQTHDVWHALTGLGTAGHEEVLLHAFSWGQLRLPVSAMIVFFGGVKHMVLEARWDALRHGLVDAWRAGRDAAPLLPVYWERHWAEPMAEVCARLGLRPPETPAPA
jgi:ubiquinone biosynthesis protein COQ4